MDHTHSDIDPLVWGDLFRALAKTMLVVAAVVGALWWLVARGLGPWLVGIPIAMVLLGAAAIVVNAWRKRDPYMAQYTGERPTD